MKNLLTVLVLLSFCFAVNAQKNNSKDEQKTPLTSQISLDQRLIELSKDISSELADNQKTTVAIADFVDLNGKSSDFGKFLAEELITRLYKTKKLKVVERQRLDKVIAEQKLSLTEIIEASSAKRIGRILGVDAIVTGTISELGNNFRINARIINTETGELLAAASATVTKDQEVCSLINCGGSRNSVQNSSNDNLPTLRRRNPDSVNQNSPSDVKTKSIQETVKPKTWVVDLDFFTFELLQCRASGSSIICDFNITNNDIDRRIGILNATAFDNENNRYEVRRSTLANQTGSMGGDSTVYGFLISGVKTKARLEFQGKSSGATKIALLELNIIPDGKNSQYPKFRDIPLY